MIEAVGRQKSVRFGDPLWTRRRASQSVVSRRLRVVSTGQPARHVSWSDFCPPYRSWTPAPSRLAPASLPSASPERYLTCANPVSSQWTRTATPSSKLLDVGLASPFFRPAVATEVVPATLRRWRAL